MKLSLGLGYISIACDAAAFGILVNFLFGTEKTLTMSKIVTLLIILIIGVIAKASCDISNVK